MELRDDRIVMAQTTVRRINCRNENDRRLTRALSESREKLRLPVSDEKKHEECQKVNQGGGEMTEEHFTMVSDKILEGDWEWSDDNTVCMFLIRLLRKIRFSQKRKWHGFDLAANEFPASIDSLCTLTHMSKTTVKRCMECLMSSGDISEKVIPNKFRIIRIDQKWILSNTDSIRLGQKYTNRSVNRKTDRKTDRGKKYPDRSANRSTPIKDNKKYSHPYRDGNTAAAPGRPTGDGLAAEQKQNEAAGSRKPGEVVSVAEIRRFAQKVYGGNDYNACDFRRGFLESGTMFPDDWQDIFIRFAGSSPEVQERFLKDLGNGVYREKWGVFG